MANKPQTQTQIELAEKKREEIAQKVKDLKAGIKVDLTRPHIVGGHQDLMDSLFSLIQIAILLPYNVDAAPAVLNFVLRVQHDFIELHDTEILHMLERGVQYTKGYTQATTKPLRDALAYIDCFQRDTGAHTSFQKLQVLEPR